MGLFGLIIGLCTVGGSCYILAFAIAGAWMNKSRGCDEKELKCHPTFIVFIPAHNEGKGILPTIDSVLRMNYPNNRFKVVIVADNCNDNTAEIAAQTGVDVWVRDEKQSRGKGQALAWAFHQARSFLFDMAVIIDADTEVDPNFLSAIAREVVIGNAIHAGAVYQGRYDFAPVRPTSTSFETLSIASKAAENSFVYRPRSRSGLITLLQGNGFCIPRWVLETVPFRSVSIVEDADYAITLAIAGIPVRYVEDARVRARMTKTVRDATSQRLRWATGTFQLVLQAVPKLLWRGTVCRDWKLIEAGLMMLFTSRLVLGYLMVGLVCEAAYVMPDNMAWSIYTLAFISSMMQVTYVWMMFKKAGDKPFAIRSLIYLPVYIAILAFVQIGSLVRLRNRHWFRTVR